MPDPTSSESQDEFLSRCVPLLVEEGRPQDQAVAMCYSYWEEAKKAQRSAADSPPSNPQEPPWSEIRALPKEAFADSQSKSFPHHWVDNGVLKLHREGLAKAVLDAFDQDKISEEVLSHLMSHLDDIKKSEEILPARVTIKKSIPEHQIVYGEVYSPFFIDTDWETMKPEDVQKMAWNFLAQGRTSKIDVQHSCEESGAVVVESFIARSDDPDFSEGSWVLGVKCPDAVWESIKEGKLNGFSLYGPAMKYPAKVLVEVARKIDGETEPSAVEYFPEHTHPFTLHLDSNGVILKGVCGMSVGHSHEITNQTATEPALEHAHRFVSEDTV
jgi:hypothetical protein